MDGVMKVVVVVGVAVVLFAAVTGVLGPTAGPWFIAIPVALFAAGVVISILSHKRRRGAIAVALESRGFTAEVDRTGVEAELEGELLRGQRSLKIRSLHRAHGPRGWVEALEYEYMTGSGKHRVLHRNFRLACDVPGDWPTFSLVPAKSFLMRPIGQWFKGPPPDVGHEAFDKRWDLSEAQVGTVVPLLSDNLVDWLAAAPKKESWAVREGRLICHWAKTVSAEEVGTMLERLETFKVGMEQSLAAVRDVHRAHTLAPVPLVGS